MAGAPKLKNPKITTQGTLRRKRPNLENLRGFISVFASGGSAQTLVGAPKLCSSDDISMRDPHCEVMLSGRTSHTRVKSIGFFVPDWNCLVGMVF